MKPDLSEFSYGFALTHELLAQFNLLGAPEFPSLYAEGTKGYDVSIPRQAAPLFLQFKLSDYLKQRNAAEFALMKRPYYRMHLRALRRSEQHNRLLDLGQSGREVFYAAPEFHTPFRLNQHFLRRAVGQHTAFFSPLDIGVLPDDGEHYVVFATGTTHGYLCSEPMLIPRTPMERVIQRVKRRALQQTEAFSYRRLTQDLVELYAERVGASAQRSIDEYRELLDNTPENEEPQILRYVARNLFDCEVLVAPLGDHDQATPPPEA